MLEAERDNKTNKCRDVEMAIEPGRFIYGVRNLGKQSTGLLGGLLWGVLDTPDEH